MTQDTGQAGSPQVRVLAVSCSRHRPLMLRHCIMQMQRQTYPVDHVIYLNSDEDQATDHSSLDYSRLIEDACSPGAGRVFLDYGPTKSPHGNYLAALALVDIEDYDLFIKIDDDDIYLKGYAEDIVADFRANRWDYSGTHSHGLLNGRRWYPDTRMQDLGMGADDHALKIPGIMPPSSAFSRRAMKAIMAANDATSAANGVWDDYMWRRVVGRTPGLVMAQRQDENFVYNIHGGNAFAAPWFKP